MRKESRERTRDSSVLPVSPHNVGCWAASALADLRAVSELKQALGDWNLRVREAAAKRLS